MKRFAAIAAMTLGLAGAASADPVEGIWKTQPGDEGRYALVTVKACGSKICGTLGQSYDSAGKKIGTDIKGRKMIWDMTPEGGGKYSGGKVWAPDRDKTYNSKMALNGNKLTVKGCFLGICRGQTWTRVK